MGLDHTIELADVKHVLDGGISFLRCMAFPPPQAPGSSVYARDAFNEDGDLMAERIVRGQSNAVLRAAGDGAQIQKCAAVQWFHNLAKVDGWIAVGRA